MMEDVKVNIGELFQDLEHWDDKKKMSECQTKAGNMERFLMLSNFN